MISFALDDEERMIEEIARNLGKLLRDGMRKWEKDGVSSEIIKKYQETGFALIDLPEELGGVNAGFFKKVLALESMAWGCAGATLFLELPSFNSHILVFADENAKSKYRDKMNKVGIYFDFDNNFSEENGKYTGSAKAVLGRDIALFFLVKDGKVLVFRNFEIQRKKPLALDAVGVNELKLSDSEPEDIFELKDKGRYFLSVARLYLSAIDTGILRASFEYSSAYAMEREAFGKKIAHHQGMAFLLSDFSIATSACQLYLWKAAWSLDTKQENFFQVCADAFSFISENAEKFTVWGVQILGGHGFVKDHPVEKWMREAKTISLLFGGKHISEIHSSEE